MKLFGLESLKGYWEASGNLEKSRVQADQAFFGAIRGNTLAHVLGVSAHTTKALFFGALSLYSLWQLMEECSNDTPHLWQRLFIPSSALTQPVVHSLFFGAISCITAYQAINATCSARRYWKNLTPLQVVANAYYTPQFVKLYLENMFSRTGLS